MTFLKLRGVQLQNVDVVKRLAYALVCLSAIMLSRSLWAQDSQAFCGNVYFNSCADVSIDPAKPLNVQIAKRHACLDKRLACGQHTYVIQTLGSMFPQEGDDYYAGMGYFGLSQKTRSHSLSCHYAQKADQLLNRFLFDFSRNINSEDASKKVLHSRKILRDLADNKDCLDNNHNNESLKNHAQNVAEELIEEVLIGDGGDAAVKKLRGDFKDFINNNLGQLVTLSSSIESSIQKRSMELALYTKYFNELVTEVESSFSKEFITIDKNRKSFEFTGALDARGVISRYSRICSEKESSNDGNCLGQKIFEKGEKLREALNTLTPIELDTKRRDALAVIRGFSVEVAALYQLAVDSFPVNCTSKTATANESCQLQAFDKMVYSNPSQLPMAVSNIRDLETFWTYKADASGCGSQNPNWFCFYKK